MPRLRHMSIITLYYPKTQQVRSLRPKTQDTGHNWSLTWSVRSQGTGPFRSIYCAMRSPRDSRSCGLNAELPISSLQQEASLRSLLLMKSILREESFMSFLWARSSPGLTQVTRTAFMKLPARSGQLSVQAA